MDRYVFLDFDGVVCTKRHRMELYTKGFPLKDDYGPFFDPETVESLRGLVNVTDAGIIITSTWKYKGWDAMQTLWAMRKMPGILLDITPTLPASFLYTRGMEINKWLNTNASNNPSEYQYVIIDDGFDFMPEQEPHLVLTDPTIGLTAKDAEKAQAILL